MRRFPNLFDLWMKFGHSQGWAQYPTCASHDGIPYSPEEELQWAAGDDPCVHVIRISEPQYHTAIKENSPWCKHRELAYTRNTPRGDAMPLLIFLFVTAPFLPGTMFKIAAIGAASLYFIANA